MNWLINILTKEARRYKENDRIRYFVQNRKGKGKGIVLTPNFQKGTVVKYNPDVRRYVVRNDVGEHSDVHPRNIVPDNVGREEQIIQQEPAITEPVNSTF
jgi:hypothetical protein